MISFFVYVICAYAQGNAISLAPLKGELAGPRGLTCAPAGAMQVSNRRQVALSESQRGCGRHLRLYEIPGEFVQAPLGSPSGGAVEQSETERGSRQLRPFEGSGEFVPAILCCHSTHPSKRNCCGGPLSQPLRAASSPIGGAKGAFTNSPWCILNGILRTAGNPSGAMRRLLLCIKQLYAALWSATPAKPFRGGFSTAYEFGIFR